MRTTTKNLMNIITSQMAQVRNVVLRYSSREEDKEVLEPDKFIKSLEHLNESGIFADSIAWEYEIIHTPSIEDYIKICSGRLMPMECEYSFELKVCEDISTENLENKLRETIFSKIA